MSAPYQPGPHNPDPQYFGGGPTASFGQATPPLASWGKRAVGWLINWFLPTALMSAVLDWIWPGNSVGTSGEVSLTQGAPAFISFLLVGLLMGFLTSNGQAPGHKIAKVQVLDKAGLPIERNQAMLRNVTHYLDQLPCLIGWLWPLWDRENQTFADKILNTHVVDVSQNPPR